MRELKLASFQKFDHAKALFDGALAFETAPDQWHYSVSIPLPTFLFRLPAIIELDVEVSRGAVRFDCMDLESHEEVGGKVTISTPGRAKVRLLVEKRGNRPVVMVRNAASDGIPAVGRIFSARSLDQYDDRDYRHLKAKTWDYWHYSYDLGDGAKVDATIAGIMPMHHLNQKIMFSLLKTGFGDVRGKSIVDVACASGFHTFELAKKAGAGVAGIDIDLPSIEQAKFLQSCSTDPAIRGIGFQPGDLLSFRASDPFDIGFCSGLFYHLLDPVGGAKALFDLVRTGAVVHSHVIAGDEEIMALADAQKYKCCFVGEFAFIPSRKMLERIFSHVGFKVRSFAPGDVVSEQEMRDLPAEFSTLFTSGNTAYYLLTK